jgi:hypothetical protein
MLCRVALAVGVCLALGGIALAQSNSPGGAPAAQPPASAAPSSDSMDPPMVGDQWTYEVRDEITGELKNTWTYTITDLTPTEIAVRVEVVPNSVGPGIFIYDRSWNLKDNTSWKYSPNDGTGIKMPLAVGDTWKFHYDQVRSGYGVTFRNVGTSRVVGKESVTTSAGTFDALKIETSINGHNTHDATKRFEQTVTTWYVPSVDHWVKRTAKSAFNGRVQANTSQELVEYGRR